MADLSQYSTEELLRMRDNLAQQPNQPAPEAKAAPVDLSQYSTEDLIRMRDGMKASQPGIMEAFGRGGMQGASLGAGDEIYAASAGALAAAQGGEFGSEYDRQLAETRANNAAAREAHPWAYGIGEAAGIIPGLVYGGSTAMGAKALGLVGKNFLTRSAASAASGAGIGAVQGFNNGEGGFEARSKDAGLPALAGLGLGAVSPAIGLGVGKAVNVATRAAKSAGKAAPELPAAAADILADDFARAGGPQAVRERLAELGPDAMLLDASPSLMGRAQGLAIQPETREGIVAPLTTRNKGTNSRLLTEAETHLGPDPIPSRVEADLAASRGLVGEQYPKVFEGAKAVDTNALAAKLETNAINLRGPARAAAGKVRGYLDIPGERGVLDPNPAALHQTRQAIDGLLDGETNRTVRWVLTEARKDVDKLLGEAVPGIKALDAQQAELFRQSEGLRRGSQIFDSGKTAIRPQEFADEIGAAALPQGEMVGPSAVPLRMRQGARGDIARLLGTHVNDLNELRKLIKGEGDWNYTKLIQAFGSKPAAKIWNAVDREAAFRDAYNKVVENSQSAQRLAAAKGVEIPEAGSGAAGSEAGPVIAGAVGGPKAAALAYGFKGVRLAAAEAQRAAALARNEGLMRSLTMRQGADLDSLVNSIENWIGIKRSAGTAEERARAITTLLTEAQGYQGSKALPESLRPAR